MLLRYDLDPEAGSAIAEWRREGRHVAIISAGIDILVEEVARRLGIEHHLANGLESDADGNLTGNGTLRWIFAERTSPCGRSRKTSGARWALWLPWVTPLSICVSSRLGSRDRVRDRTRAGALPGLVDAWADSFESISRTVRELE